MNDNQLKSASNAPGRRKLSSAAFKIVLTLHSIFCIGLMEDSAGYLAVTIRGGNVVQQYLNAGFIDEFTLLYSPGCFGGGTQLFFNVNHDSK